MAKSMKGHLYVCPRLHDNDRSPQHRISVFSYNTGGSWTPVAAPTPSRLQLHCHTGEPHCISCTSHLVSESTSSPRDIFPSHHGLFFSPIPSIRIPPLLPPSSPLPSLVYYIPFYLFPIIIPISSDPLGEKEFILKRSMTPSS